MIKVQYKNKRQDCGSWLTVLTIQLASACFQLEYLWPNKVLETSRRQWRLQLALGLIQHPAAAAFHAFTKSLWLILTAVFNHIPSLNVSKKAARNDSHHHQCEEIYIFLHNGSLSSLSSSPYVKKVCVESVTFCHRTVKLC